MKKILLSLLSGTLIFTSTRGVIALASEKDTVKVHESIVLNQDDEINVDEDLYQLASLSIDDLLNILSSEGIDPYTVFTQDEIDMQRLREMLRNGTTKIVNINSTTKDVYINSAIATTLKYVGFATIGKYIKGWQGVAVGAVGANITTSNGIIVRYKKQNGHEWGVNGAVWAITGVRSQ